jgi:ketosteroid isomerase-like protein
VRPLFSKTDDVTLGNPFGPVAKGWEHVLDAMERAAQNYRDGEALGFDNSATVVTPELAYLVEVERLRAKVGGRSETSDLALRVTTILRQEQGTWKIIHRHADPITSVRPRARSCSLRQCDIATQPLMPHDPAIVSPSRRGCDARARAGR